MPDYTVVCRLDVHVGHLYRAFLEDTGQRIIKGEKVVRRESKNPYDWTAS